MKKTLTLLTSCLAGLALLGALPPESSGQPGGPPPPPKKKGRGGPAEDLRKAYNILRRLRADNRAAGRPEERLRDWTDRAVRLYRDGIRAYESGDPHLAHEYGASAHDLARAVDHARNASLYEERDSELPPPPGDGPEGDDSQTRFDLRRAYDRVREGRGADEGREAKFYLDAARDLYNAARRDAVAGRTERAGELARAAEAITHVPEHLAHAAANGEEPPPPEPKEKAKAKKKADRKNLARDFDDGPAAKKKDFKPKRPPRPDFEPESREGSGRRDDLPPPLEER